MAANPRMLNATQTKDAFGFDNDWYIVNGFNPAQDVLDIIGTAYAVEINDAESGIGGTLILKDKLASTENLTREQILSLDGIFLQGVAAANITAQNVRQGGTVYSAQNNQLLITGTAAASGLSSSTTITPQIVEQTPLTTTAAATTTSPLVLTARTGVTDVIPMSTRLSVVQGFNPTEGDIVNLGNTTTAYALSIEAAQNGGVGGTIIFASKPSTNLTQDQLLSVPGVFLAGVPLETLGSINFSKDTRVVSLTNENNFVVGSATNINTTGIVIEQPQTTSGTIIQQSPATITQTPTIIAGNGFTTNSGNTAEKVKILDGKGIFGTPGSDLGQFSDNGSTGNAQNTTRVVNALGGNNILSISTPGTYIGGAGDDVFNVETAPGVINIMAGRGADTVAISGGATTNNSATTSGKSVNVLLGGSNQNGDGAADTVAIDVRSLDSNTRIQIAQWDTNDKIELGNAILNYSVVMLQNGMIQADLTSADNGAVISTTLNATDRAAFETMLGVSNT